MRSLHLALLFAASNLHAQVINGYAEITAIAGSTLTVGTTNEAAALFQAGKDIVIMQMQDNVIGSNTANNAAFGNLSAIQQAGRFEVRRIAAVTRTAGALTSITLVTAPGIAFSFGTNARVQAITHELLGAGGNYTTTANISALDWNGTLGGVVALRVGGTLSLQHSITADGAGFRGGARDRFSYLLPCNTTDFRWSSTAAGTEYFAEKGEGIYRLTNNNWRDGRGKIINGGGGANQVNAGGGGGGNYTAGGSAVLGWSCAADAGGIGGIALSGHITGTRIFMGGGGGGGEGNDDVSTNGADGGGVILIEAGAITTTGTCSIVISANGASAANSGNDGAGGGGAGGTILIDAATWSVAAGCPLTIRANGGNGGSVNSSTHGGGGGGGQGAVIFSGLQPTTNITTNTLNGQGGCNQTPCSTYALNGAGSNNSGILTGLSTPLPVELLSFQAIPVNAQVQLRWATATEQNNAYFTVERSPDGVLWAPVLQVPGAGDSQGEQQYAALDEQPLPRLSYYRLRQTDHDGHSTTSDAVAVQLDAVMAGVHVFPNPASDRVMVVHGPPAPAVHVEMLDELGRSIHVPLDLGDGISELDVSALPAGVYTVVVATSDRRQAQRVVVRR
ncbi:MAG TPA: T9SS type A sorting domain-containing protein [Flavobacteriales bacterium]|nr:T9SS type A sorting domain-containing protein [Flavobacteriales bacterium]HMR25871.1 T9SS type A sorting domain-containing protein [Flavobacteriales bacterium]